MAIGRIPEPGTGIPESIIAAKGDLIVGTANDTPGILSVGTNGHTLVADSAEATGLKWAAPAAGGKVLQVVSATTTTNVSVTTATYTDTNLTATITPTLSTSKILILTSQPIYVTRGANEAGAGVRLLRNGTTIVDQGGTGFYTHQVYVANGTSVGNQSVNSQTYLDSPSTTSAVTYKTQIRCYTATNSATAQAQIDSMVSSMVLLEIGA